MVLRNTGCTPDDQVQTHNQEVHHQRSWWCGEASGFRRSTPAPPPRPTEVPQQASTARTRRPMHRRTTAPRRSPKTSTPRQHRGRRSRCPITTMRSTTSSKCTRPRHRRTARRSRMSEGPGTGRRASRTASRRAAAGRARAARTAAESGKGWLH